MIYFFSCFNKFIDKIKCQPATLPNEFVLKNRLTENFQCHRQVSSYGNFVHFTISRLTSPYPHILTINLFDGTVFRVCYSPGPVLSFGAFAPDYGNRDIFVGNEAIAESRRCCRSWRGGGEEYKYIIYMLLFFFFVFYDRPFHISVIGVCFVCAVGAASWALHRPADMNLKSWQRYRRFVNQSKAIYFIDCKYLTKHFQKTKCFLSVVCFIKQWFACFFFFYGCFVLFGWEMPAFTHRKGPNWIEWNHIGCGNVARLNCLIISNAHKKFHHRNYVFVTSDKPFFDK